MKSKMKSCRIEGTTIDGKSSRNYKTARDYDVIRKTFEEFSASQSIKVRDINEKGIQR